MTEYFRVGIIRHTHALKGEVKVFSTSSEEARFEKLKTVYLSRSDDNFKKEESQEVNIESVRYFNNLVILKFKEFNKIEEVSKYVHYSIWIKRDDALELKDGEYYVADIIGLDCVDDMGHSLGKIVDCMQTGANDVYVVKNESGEIYIPAIKDCIVDINFEKNVMKVHLLEGL